MRVVGLRASCMIVPTYVSVEKFGKKVISEPSSSQSSQENQ